MKMFVKALITASILSIISFHLSAQSAQTSISSHASDGKQLYIDVHRLEPGKVTYEGVAQVHAKDLAVQANYGVQFLKYWVDEQKGLVYCLSSASDTTSIHTTHAQAHGLLPAQIYQVSDGPEAAIHGKGEFFLDVHELGAGKVTEKDVAEAHEKDLAVQQKHGVNFINYWVDENSGTVMCLSEAKNATSVIHTHKEAHGLVPVYILKVKQGE